MIWHSILRASRSLRNDPACTKSTYVCCRLRHSRSPARGLSTRMESNGEQFTAAVPRLQGETGRMLKSFLALMSFQQSEFTATQHENCDIRSRKDPHHRALQQSQQSAEPLNRPTRATRAPNQCFVTCSISERRPGQSKTSMLKELKRSKLSMLSVRTRTKEVVYGSSALLRIDAEFFHSRERSRAVHSQARSGVITHASSFSANLVGEPLQDLLSEHTGTAELGALFHQLAEYVFSISADASKALDINHELTTA